MLSKAGPVVVVELAVVVAAAVVVAVVVVVTVIVIGVILVDMSYFIFNHTCDIWVCVISQARSSARSSYVAKTFTLDQFLQTF